MNTIKKALLAFLLLGNADVDLDTDSANAEFINDAKEEADEQQAAKAKDMPALNKAAESAKADNQNQGQGVLFALSMQGKLTAANTKSTNGWFVVGTDIYKATKANDTWKFIKLNDKAFTNAATQIKAVSPKKLDVLTTADSLNTSNTVTLTKEQIKGLVNADNTVNKAGVESLFTTTAATTTKATGKNTTKATGKNTTKAKSGKITTKATGKNTTTKAKGKGKTKSAQK